MADGIFKTIYITGSRLRGTPVLPYLSELNESQWWDMEKIRVHQLDKLRGLLIHAEKNSPFYRKIFSANGFKPDIGSLSDLERLPTTSKDEIKNNFAEIQNPGLGGSLILTKTSGSTGEPLKFYRGSEWDAQHRAAIARGYSWYDVDPWTRRGMLWGIPAGRMNVMKARAGDFFQNRFRQKKYDLSEDTLESFYRKLSNVRVLEGYPSMLYEFAKYINVRHPEEKPLSLSLIKATSEKIYPRFNDEAVKAFGRKLTSEYGSAEAGIIAFECPEGNMHINMEHVIVEQEDGEIILTNLLSHSFPFIRYRLGDMIVMPDGIECSCGRKSPIITEVSGRIGKSVYGRSGLEFPGMTVDYIIKILYMDCPVLFRLQAVQEEKGRLDFLAILDDKPDSRTVTDLKERFERLTSEYYGEEIDSRLLPVKSIRDSGSKKIEFISRIMPESPKQ